MKGFGHIPTNILYFTLNISTISICRDLKRSQKKVKIECFVFTESYFSQNCKVLLASSHLFTCCGRKWFTDTRTAVWSTMV